MDSNKPNICVVGAGVVGMTVARLLQEELRNAQVTVMADKFNLETTSCVAAGIFRPGTSFKGPSREVTKRWIADSWHHWKEICRTADAERAGLMEFSAYIFSKENYHVTRNHLIEDLVPIYRAADENELKMCGDGWKYGSFFTTLKIDCERYLPWAERAVAAHGGRIVAGKIDSFSALARQRYDLVFNCTGLGAKHLCNDHDLVPMRGQVIKLRAPWLKTAFYGDYDTYIVPGFGGVATVGGVRQYDSYNTTVCEHDAAAILERGCGLLPQLRKAQVVGHGVGLRPHRVPVRVEAELVGGLRVVHCYGHGGYGVTCAPGTAAHALRIGLDLLRSNLKHKL